MPSQRDWLRSASCSRARERCFSGVDELKSKSLLVTVGGGKPNGSQCETRYGTEMPLARDQP